MDASSFSMDTVRWHDGDSVKKLLPTTKWLIMENPTKLPYKLKNLC